MMKLFEIVQRNLALMGYSPNQRPFTKKQIQIGVTKALCISLHGINLIYVANTPKEYMQSIFDTSVTVLVFISFISTILKMNIIFILIDKLQALVNDSKLNLNV